MASLLEVVKKVAEDANPIGTYDDELDCSTENFTYNVYNAGRSVGLDIYYLFGATQLCFIDEENQDYVIKMPFVNKCGSKWITDDNGEEVEEDWSELYSRDYTKECVNIYKKAVDAGVAMFFARVEHVCNGVWKQEFVTAKSDCSSPRIEKISKEEIERANNLRRKYSCGLFDPTWVADCLFYYGQELFNKFIAFIDKENIDDLHNGNYGWTKNGYPRLLDYSGYHE